MVYEKPGGFARISSFVADKHEFWWNERKPNERVLWESKIELGEKFFNEIIHHPVPLDMNTLKALKRCALGLISTSSSLTAPSHGTAHQSVRKNSITLDGMCPSIQMRTLF